jgi:hypothetical protein
MIIFNRTIKHLLFGKYSHENKAIASVNTLNQVYLEIGNGSQSGVLFTPEDAIVLGEAIIRAARGQGIPAGPSTPGTSDE